jgi:uncharacterized protein YjcR
MFNFTRNRAQIALLIATHDELINRMDRIATLLETQIEVERNFVNTIQQFFSIEKKLRVEEQRRKETAENLEKKRDADDLY